MKVKANPGKVGHGAGVDDRSPKYPLKDKKIFLQLHGFRGIAKFERDIVLLGGVIERCFSREVDCLITSRGTPADYEKSKKHPVSSPSPVTPSPFNLGSVGVDSPQGHSPGSMEPQKPLTRGKAMAQAAKTTKTYGSTDVVEAARSWKIKIIHIDTALRWVTKQVEKLPAEFKNSSKKDESVSRQIKSRRLRGSFMKFEAIDRHYRPIQQEFKSLPQIYFESPPWTCPFYKKGDKKGKIDERGEGEERDPQGAGAAAAADIELLDDGSPKIANQNKKGKGKTKRPSSEDWFGGKVLTAGEIRRMSVEKKKAEMRRGYCELCQMKYENIDKHVVSDVHRKFVKDDRNYASLDRIIRSGPTVQQFMQDILASHQIRKLNNNNSPSQDEVLVLTEWSSSQQQSGLKEAPRNKTRSDKNVVPHNASPGKRTMSRNNSSNNITPVVGKAGASKPRSPAKFSPKKKKRMTTPVKKTPTISRTDVPHESPQKRSTRLTRKVDDTLQRTPVREKNKGGKQPSPLKDQVPLTPKKSTPIKTKKGNTGVDVTPTRLTSPKTKGESHQDILGRRLTRTSGKVMDVKIAQAEEKEKIDESKNDLNKISVAKRLHGPCLKLSPGKSRKAITPKKTPSKNDGEEKGVILESPRKVSTRTNGRSLNVSSLPLVNVEVKKVVPDPGKASPQRRTRHHLHLEDEAHLSTHGDTVTVPPKNRARSASAEAQSPDLAKIPSSPLATPPTVRIIAEVVSTNTARTIKRILKKRGSPRVVCERIDDEDLNQLRNELSGQSDIISETEVSGKNYAQGHNEIESTKTKRCRIQEDKKVGVLNDEKITTVEEGPKSGPVRKVRSSLRHSRRSVRHPPSTENLADRLDDGDMLLNERETIRTVGLKSKSKDDNVNEFEDISDKKENNHPSLAVRLEPEDEKETLPAEQLTPKKVQKLTPKKVTPAKRTPKEGVAHFSNAIESSPLNTGLITTPRGKSTPVPRGRNISKHKEPWSVLSERSMAKILEEDSDTEFEGFSKDTVNRKVIPSDASFDEVEGGIGSSKEWNYTGYTPESGKSPGDKKIIICGLDEEASPESTCVTPVKNILKNMSKIMSDASSTGWDDNLDDFLEVQVKKQVQEPDTYIDPSALVLEKAESPRRSPRKQLNNPSPFNFVVSPTKVNSSSTAASAVRRSPRKSLLAGNTSSALNRSWDCVTPNTSLFRDTCQFVDLWVGPTKNEKSTPSYVQKSVMRQQLKSPNTPGMSSPIYRQSKEKPGQSPLTKAAHSNVHKVRRAQNTEQYKMEDSTGIGYKKGGVESNNVAGKTEGIRVNDDTADDNVKDVDSEIQFKFSSPKKEVEDALNLIRLPSPLTPLDRTNACRTNPSSLNKSLTDNEASESDPEATKKKLLKFSSSTKKKFSLGFTSYEFTGKSMLTATPSTSGVKLSNLGSAVKAPTEYLNTTPRTSKIIQSPLRQSPRKTNLRKTPTKNNLPKEETTPSAQKEKPLPTDARGRNKLALKRGSGDRKVKSSPKKSNRETNKSDRGLDKSLDLYLNNSDMSEKQNSSFCTPKANKSRKLSLTKHSTESRARRSPSNKAATGKSANISLNDSDVSERPLAICSTPKSLSPVKKLNKLLKLHTHKLIQCGRSKKMTANTSLNDRDVSERPLAICSSPKSLSPAKKLNKLLKRHTRDVIHCGPSKKSTANTSLNDSDVLEKPSSTCSTPRTLSPSKKLHKILQLHSLDVIQCGPRRKSSSVVSVVRFSSAGSSPEESPHYTPNTTPIQRKTPVLKTTPVNRKSPSLKKSPSLGKSPLSRKSSRSPGKQRSSRQHFLIARLTSGSGTKSSIAADNIRSKALARLRSKSLGSSPKEYKNWSKNKCTDWSIPEAQRPRSVGGTVSRSKLSTKRGTDKMVNEGAISQPRKKLRLEPSQDRSSKSPADNQQGRQLRQRPAPPNNGENRERPALNRKKKKDLSYYEFSSEGEIA